MQAQGPVQRKPIQVQTGPGAAQTPVLWCRHLQEQYRPLQCRHVHLQLRPLQRRHVHVMRWPLQCQHGQVQLRPLLCGVYMSRCNTGKNKVEQMFQIGKVKNKDKKTKTMFLGSKRRKTNIFIPKLSKERRKTNLFVPQLSKERRQTKVIVPQPSKE